MSMAYSFSWKQGRLLLTLFLFTLAKLAIHQFQWEVWTFDSLTGTLFAAASFIFAFMLSGTLRDYSLSAYVPLEIANAIDAIADTNQLVAEAHPDYSPVSLKAELLNIAQNTLAWLQAGQSVDAIEASLENLNLHFAEMLTSGDAPIISRVQGEQAKIRLLINRIRLVRDTDFLKPAYTLLGFFWVGVSVTLLLIKTAFFVQNLAISALIFATFTYLLQLIRDLDNPFDYEGQSTLDVDLSALHEVRDRFLKSISQDS